METAKALAALGALAQETRLAVFRLLVQAGRKGLPAGAIGERLDLPGPTLSFHLAQLRAAELVACRRESRSLIYSASYATTNGLVAYLLENCCGSEAASGAAACRPAPARAKRSRSQPTLSKGDRHEAPARSRRRR
jgi:DNA-binding transcriptional ArsR family regulator